MSDYSWKTSVLNYYENNIHNLLKYFRIQSYYHNLFWMLHDNMK